MTPETPTTGPISNRTRPFHSTGMKLLNTPTLVLLGAAALALLTAPAVAGSCPTLRATVKAPRNVRNNKLYTVVVAVKNTGASAANDLTVAVRPSAVDNVCWGPGQMWRGEASLGGPLERHLGGSIGIRRPYDWTRTPSIHRPTRPPAHP